MAFSSDGRTALTGGKDCFARRWNTRTGKLIGQPLRHRHPVWAVSFSPDGKTILTGSGDDEIHVGEVRLWDAKSGESLGPPLPHPDGVHVAVFSPDGKRSLTVCDEEIRLYELANRQRELPGSESSTQQLTLPVRRLPHPLSERRVAAIQPRLWAMFSPDGKLVLSGGEDGTARLWDAAKGEPMRHEGPVLSMDISSDGKTIATGSYDGAVRMWDVAARRQRGPDLMHPGRALAVAIRFDGQFIASGSRDGRSWQWPLEPVSRRRLLRCASCAARRDVRGISHQRQSHSLGRRSRLQQRLIFVAEVAQRAQRRVRRSLAQTAQAGIADQVPQRLKTVEADHSCL